MAKVSAFSEAMGRCASPASCLSRAQRLVSRRISRGTNCSIRSTDRSLCRACPTSTLPCYTNMTRVRLIPCRHPIPDTQYYRPQLYRYRAVQIFLLKIQFCAWYNCVPVIYVWGICAKIGYRLETIGVRCNSVDC